MVLSLATPSISNDAMQLTFTDNTTWTSPAYPDGVSSWFKLALTAQTYNGTTTFDVITDAAFFNNYNQSNKSFVLTANMLKVLGIEQYGAGDMIPDALYTVTYTLNNSTGVVQTYQIQFMNPQQCKIDIYNDFNNVPYVWDKKQIDLTTSDMRALLEPIRKWTLLQAMYAEPYQTNETRMLLILEILTRLINE